MRILLIDIETAPNKVYTWGLFNQNISLNQIDEAGYTLCWAAKWIGEHKTQFSAIWNDGKEKMLKRVYNLLSEADVVIHYNGINFDIPTLNKEFLSMGWGPPAPFQQIDMYRIARSQFKLVSNKLDYVLKFLDIPGKLQHKGMPLWIGVMEGNPPDLNIMEKYNKGDVTKLEQVYLRLKPWIRNHPNFGLYMDSDRPVCPNCGSHHLQKRGLYRTPTLTYQRYKCIDCGTWSKDRYTNMDPDKRVNVLKGV